MRARLSNAHYRGTSRYDRRVLEIDHAICFLPSPSIDLSQFTVEPGRVHTGQGTRNVRVMFERNYLELIWIEHPGEVLARGLDFVARCARPASACPFGLVVRGAIPPEHRARFAPYELPDAPGVVLQLLTSQPVAAPFLAVFETADLAAMWPGRRVAPGYLEHPCGAMYIRHATFTAREPLPFPVSGVTCVAGEPRLELELGALTVSYCGVD